MNPEPYEASALIHSDRYFRPVQALCMTCGRWFPAVRTRDGELAVLASCTNCIYYLAYIRQVHGEAAFWATVDEKRDLCFAALGITYASGTVWEYPLEGQHERGA